MQYRLIKQYLEELTQEQTLVIESGHPLGLFRSRPDAPRVIITNSMMTDNSTINMVGILPAQMGVANYGQMTAGGWMYIGSSRHCAWHFQHPPECRTIETRHSTRPRFAGTLIYFFRFGRNEWCTT